MEYVEIALSFVFTAAVYCAFPLLFAFLRKSPITKKKYRLLCIVVTASVAIAFQILRTVSDLSGNAFAPALLWGTVFYNVGLSILRKRRMLSGTTPPQQPPEPVSSPTPAPDASHTPSPAPAKPTPPPPITETWYTCPSCGCLLPTGEICACGYHPPKAAAAAPACRKWPIIAIAVLAVALACSLFYNVEQHNKNTQAQVQLKSKQETIDYYADTVRSLREQALSVNSYIDAVSFYASHACVVSSGSSFYHRDPTCADCNLSYFWIYNVEKAISLGYSQCPNCSDLSPSGRTSSYLQYLIDQNK